MQVRQRSAPKRHSSNSSEEIQYLRKELKAERAARAKAEARVQELEWKVEALETELEALRKSRNEEREFLQREIRRLEKAVVDRDELLEKVNAQPVWFRENFLAGNRSERDGADSEPAEEMRSQSQPEDSDSNVAGTESSEHTESGYAEATESNTKRKRGQQRDKKGPGRSDRALLRTESEYREKKDCACAKCGKAYRRLSVTKQSPLIELYTELVRILHERYIYVPDCDCAENKPVTADPPPKLYDRTDIGACREIRRVA